MPLFYGTLINSNPKVKTIFFFVNLQPFLLLINFFFSQTTTFSHWWTLIQWSQLNLSLSHLSSPIRRLSSWPKKPIDIAEKHIQSLRFILLYQSQWSWFLLPTATPPPPHADGSDSLLEFRWEVRWDRDLQGSD